MSPSNDHKKIKIIITTYSDKNKDINQKKGKINISSMCDHTCKKPQKDRKFFCSLCLNERRLDGVEKGVDTQEMMKNRLCPMCQGGKVCIETRCPVAALCNRKCNTSPREKRIDPINTCPSDEVTEVYRQSKEKNKNHALKHEQNNKQKHEQNHEQKHEQKHKQRHEQKHEEKRNVASELKSSVMEHIDINKRNSKNCEHGVVKYVETQTSDHGINLLNEVLTVFQNRKSIKSCECKSICKDASIQVAGQTVQKFRSNLSMSKTTKYSIDDESAHDQSGFLILESRQPDASKSHHNGCYFRLKPKSSSIPQMKLEELQYSMKEKTKSKDTVDEVNRMFAIVGNYKSNGKRSREDTNRPMVRSGPRILPVVKTKLEKDKDNLSFSVKEMRDNFSDVPNRCQLDSYCCKFCQTNTNLSGGDSSDNCGCSVGEARCDKCVFLLSCLHNNKRNGLLICECCKNKNFGCKCTQHNCITFNE